MLRAALRTSSREALFLGHQSRAPCLATPLHAAERQRAITLGKQRSKAFSLSVTPQEETVWQVASASNFQKDFSDVTIVGGGVVGLALASSLASNASFQSSGATLTLVEGSSLEPARSWAARKDDGSAGTISDWENRVIYLTEDNKHWLENVGITPFLSSKRLGPVHSMHVTDGISGAALDFNAPDPSTSRMGMMVEIGNLQQAMLRQVEELRISGKVNVKILDSSRVEAIVADGERVDDEETTPDTWPVLRLSSSRTALKSRLLVGADGNNSPVRNYAGIKATGWEYGRLGIVATLRFANRGILSDRTAYQRFLPTGTIAWLPLSDDAASMVWTLPPTMGRAIIAMQKVAESSEEQGIVPPLAHLITAAFRLPWSSLEGILQRLADETYDTAPEYSWVKTAIEEKLVTIAADMPADGQVPAPVSRIHTKSVAGFPLKLSHAECYLGSSRMAATFAESGAGALQPSKILGRLLSSLHNSPTAARPIRGRTALIGDAAHTIHPLAGQGLNLGLADAKSLSTAIIQALERGEDLGSHVSLNAYPRERYLVNQAMLSAVDHLHWLFATPPPGDAASGLLTNIWSQAVVWGRSSGFEILNELGGVKRTLMGVVGSENRR